MCKVDSKEACESLRFQISERRGVVKTSGVRRCVRSGAGAVAARVWHVTRLILGVVLL